MMAHWNGGNRLEDIRLENGKMETKEQTKQEGLALLRAPFPPNQISSLPKPTKAQTDEVKANFKSGIRCVICGGWHHPKVVHLDYVGHAALTDRLLDADPFWTWEPLAIGNDGLPVIDKDGGLWIRLTVCGVTRLGYGDAQGKTGGDAMKERIGDALRNAAMRFGAALDLWHKGDLHVATDDDDGNVGAKAPTNKANPENERAALAKKLNAASRRGSVSLRDAWEALTPAQRHEMADIKDDLKSAAAMQDEAIATQA